MLSWILIDGDHRKPDYAQAREWALKAAAQGVAASMTRLGLLYHNALGVERDADAAARWWRKAGTARRRRRPGHAGRGAITSAPASRAIRVTALAWLTRASAGAQHSSPTASTMPCATACTPKAAPRGRAPRATCRLATEAAS